MADLRGKIAAGELVPGAKLPNEMELAKSYGVARGTVREAVKALTLMRLFERSTAGTFVTAEAPGHVPDDSLVDITSEDPDCSSLYESRILLEKHVILLACERATEHDLAQIRAALERAERAANRVAALEADLEYHHALAEAAHSPVLRYLYMVTTDAIARAYQTFLPLYTEPNSADWGLANHKEIARAIEQQDSGTAQRIAEESLERAAAWVKDMVRLSSR
ncbi:FCD domain-containing protein [Saccharopolyspora sp. WRP15-2]|uniref:FCD domain-containing protein n=1 Tax=Saccharopolyspora oryzae TaxID=2997343 RepID=A0ABT4UZ03_9PSEU|nr:FCD domain-containing protein [Saccharopolyspora oryzae]MDA3626349.1 FCD domain-containing protein [Saccharopolyspora oryzae]